MPAIPILYTSGYAGDEVTRRRLLDPRAEFIAKPFTPEALARAVRTLLDAAPSQG
jgi:CheY-like chemotaxis protein